MKKAFTLVELLMATAVLGILMASVVVTLSTVFKNARKAEAVGIVNAEGATALKSMENMIRYAKSIDSCSSTSLTITRLNNETVTYDILINKIASHSATAIYNLTSSAVRATDCGGTLFICDPPDNKTVGICFNLENANAVTGDITTRAGVSGVQFKSQITLRNWGL